MIEKRDVIDTTAAEIAVAGPERIAGIRFAVDEVSFSSGFCGRTWFVGAAYRQASHLEHTSL